METKRLDNFTCQFCGYKDPEGTLLDAAHLLERKDVSQKTPEEASRYCAERGVYGIDNCANMISLCTRKCHTKFDDNEIGFTRERKWVVRDTCKEKSIRCLNEKHFYYGDFDGNRINLTRNVSDELVEHRVLKYEEKSNRVLVEEAKARKSSNGKKKSNPRKK